MNRQYFRLLPLWLATGLLVAVVLPALVLPGWRLLFAPMLPMHMPSMAFVALSFTGAMFSLCRFEWFPGERSIFAGIPLLFGWTVFWGVLLLTLRLPYSLAYLMTGLALSLVLLLLQAVWMRARIPCMAYVPLGRADHVETIQGVNWVCLHQPELPDDGKMPDAIVADLHAPALTDAWQKFLAACTLRHIPVFNIRQVEEALTGRVKIRHMYENTLGSLLPNPIYMVIKYVLEVCIITCLLPFVLPVILLVAVAIKLEDGGPVFYNQQRVGYRGRPFTMYKFRSMAASKALNQETETRDGDERITRVGRFIRKTRIDELPQFINVILGTMSLIGPRPEYKKFADDLERKVPFYQYRHIVKPGISGWAQVMHGYATGVDETQVKIEHDFYYIKNFSLSLDCLIAVKTLHVVLTGKGAR